MRKRQRRVSWPASTRRRRFSPLMLIGVGVTVVLALVGVAVFAIPKMASHAAAANGDCSLMVPPNPLSAAGLAEPYQLMATNSQNGPCNEANPAQAAFVQGAVIDTVTGKIAVYNPLVIDAGTRPAARPVLPKITASSVVALWFGFNGNNLTLMDANGSLGQGKCVNGTQKSIFGQFAYCNAPAFFNAANQAIGQGKLVVPPLGVGSDGKTCPSVRDFSVVDMDQSDNVTTAYLLTDGGKMAQDTGANAARFPKAVTQVNASDNRLVAVALDGALGCTPWQAPDLANNGALVPALPLNELQAAYQQAAPVALVPAGDPMVIHSALSNLFKDNLYRRGVDQPQAGSMSQISTTTYCRHLLNIAPARMQLDETLTKARPSPDPAVANSLFTFLAQRFVATFSANGLNCVSLLQQPEPITLVKNANGQAIDATFNNGSMTGNATPTSITSTPVTGKATPTGVISTPVTGNTTPTATMSTSPQGSATPKP